MTNVDIKKANRNLSKFIKACLCKEETIKISSKDGNVVLLSETRFNSMIESLYLLGIKGVYEDVEETVNTPTAAFIEDSPLN